jgi:DMSO reductase family type II enzyme chaperone
MEGTGTSMPAVANVDLAVPIDWHQIDLYRFFAHAFASPTLERFGLLSQPGLPGALQGLWKELGCDGKFPGFEWFATYDEYESSYIELFDVGIPEPPVPLFESAHDKSHPAQEIALENTYFYDVLGLKSDPSHAVPDYLVTQLEFLAALHYTREHTSDESAAVALARAETEFLQRHLLNWIPNAKAKLQRLNAPGFSLLLTMLEQFLRHSYSCH